MPFYPLIIVAGSICELSVSGARFTDDPTHPQTPFPGHSRFFTCARTAASEVYTTVSAGCITKSVVQALPGREHKGYPFVELWKKQLTTLGSVTTSPILFWIDILQLLGAYIIRSSLPTLFDTSVRSTVGFWVRGDGAHPFQTWIQPKTTNLILDSHCTHPVSFVGRFWCGVTPFPLVCRWPLCFYLAIARSFGYTRFGTFVHSPSSFRLPFLVSNRRGR